MDNSRGHVVGTNNPFGASTSNNFRDKPNNPFGASSKLY